MQGKAGRNPVTRKAEDADATRRLACRGWNGRLRPAHIPGPRAARSFGCLGEPSRRFARGSAAAVLLLAAVLAGLPSCAGTTRHAAVSPGALSPIELLPPDTLGGKPLMQALQERQSGRSYREDDLSLEDLSNLLWAAFGVNRPDSGKRTAPSALNWQEIDVYVAMRQGLFLYNAKAHRLDPILDRDIRAETGGFIQPFVKKAPVNLVYVADFSRTGGLAAAVVPDSEKRLYAGVSTGCISQNVYLYCASAGLSTVVRGYVDKPDLAAAMGLREHQEVILAQSVGYPK